MNRVLTNMYPFFFLSPLSTTTIDYCYLTDEGIEYLRSYLALPPEIVPATHKVTNKRPESRDREEDKFTPGGRPAFNDKSGGGFGRGGGI